ncbi:SIR2 family protein [Magnetospirillum aberrantis]|uniref:SIR2 family protein n=1 Tax=Magnetospirillum aberrantis SpK TaxID=908842 RepID=A0A7C9UX85_9PROT|nr:SIR2 family protein [Magnetospirillum aberrantis]NFV80692.1 SIR2 family protein [Magnetospirillum aberrantis SpK]
MDAADFALQFASRPPAFAWFLGAGASRMSGLPTATDIIWDLKSQYYCKAENQDVSRQDMQNEAVRSRIQAFMDSRGFPALWDDSEYSLYFEKIFGADKERQRNYLRKKLSEDRVTLTVGNRILGALMASGMTRAIFTTNFDSVVERAFAEVSGRTLMAYHLDGSTAALQALSNEEFPLYCKLHGDFRYDSVKNLSRDLSQQDQQLALAMQSAAGRFGFIIAGYSGRDESVMRLFRDALQQPTPFPNGLFWMTMKGAPALPVVQNLITEARAVGVRAELVEIDTYDSLMISLWRNIPDKPRDLDIKVRRTIPATVSIPIPHTGNDLPLIRLNALPITGLPNKALVARVKQPLTWSDLRELQRAAGSSLIFTKGKEIWCWGAQTELKAAFAGNLVELVESNIPSDLNDPEHLHFKRFMEEGLVTAIARDRPLLSRSERFGSILIVDPHAEDKTALNPVFQQVSKLSGDIPGLFAPVSEEFPAPRKISWAEALRVSIAQKSGQTWAVIEPDIWIWPRGARKLAADFMDGRRQGRFNNKFDALMDAWVRVVIGSDQRGIACALQAFPGPTGPNNPLFTLGSRTAYTKRLST